MFRIKYFHVVGLIFLCFLTQLTGCMSTPKPHDIDNICAIFNQYPDWYWAARKSAVRWRVPISVQMSIMRQESSFLAKAKPPRTKLLWVIPWRRESDAYGYAQIKNSTWDNYKKATGTHFASRSNFGDAINFIGWYANSAHTRAGIAKNDAYRLYLAYHEGVGGYQRGTYRNKAWLIKVSKHVGVRASVWRQELLSCQSRIHKPWYEDI